MYCFAVANYDLDSPTVCVEECMGFSCMASSTNDCYISPARLHAVTDLHSTIPQAPKAKVLK